MPVPPNLPSEAQRLALPRRAFVRRAGLSLPELLGCLLAVAGGVWIGARYLGVDLNGAAYQALDESELLTQLPEEWRPPNPECPDGECPDPAEQRALEAAQLRQELDAVRLEVAYLRGAEPTPADHAGPLDAEQLHARTATVRYWQHLVEVIDEVRRLNDQVEPLGAGEDRARVLAVRRRAYRYGHRAIEHLDRDAVDQKAAEVGARVATWCDAAATMLQQAVELASVQPVGGRTVHADKLWGQAQTDHQMRTDLVRRKASDAQAYLNGRYLVEFPVLSL